MRKIEALMIAAVKSHKAWKSGNTEVTLSAKDGLPNVYLHGNLIASVTKNGLLINDCGWQTVTTKSRLNALFLGLNLPAHVYQKRNVWRLTNRNSETIVEPHDMNLVQF